MVFIQDFFLIYFNPRSPQRERSSFGDEIFAIVDISIHAPRKGSDRDQQFYDRIQVSISIHAPRKGSDGRILRPHFQGYDFNPRSPQRERFTEFYIEREEYDISIHAPRKGSDCGKIYRRLILFYFNPRSPQRERFSIPATDFTKRGFQSTLPAKGAIINISAIIISTNISIHAPRKGSDLQSFTSSAKSTTFQSTLPAKGAIQHKTPKGQNYIDFNPRSPQRERCQA